MCDVYIIPRCEICRKREAEVGEVPDGWEIIDGKLKNYCCLNFAEGKVASSPEKLFCKLLCEKCWTGESLQFEIYKYDLED